VSKLIKPLNFTLGILDPADYTNPEKYGGSTGYIKSILPYMVDNKVIIVGLGINGTSPWRNIMLSNSSKFIPIADLSYPSKIPMRLKALFVYSRYRNKILNLGFDVLYVHSPEICLPFLFFNKKVPVIYHQHGHSNALHSSKYSYGEARIFRKFFDFALWLIHKKASWTIAIDPIGLQQSAKHGAREKTSLLLNAVNNKLFKPDQKARVRIRNRFGLHAEEVAIFNAGRIEKQKGIQRLLACIPLLKSKGLRFHIFIAGDGTYKGHLKGLVKSYDGGKNVTFLGRVTHKHLPEFYNMADVFVLPSEREGVPMAILEAIACGTPVIANRIGGIPKFLRNGVNGMLLDDLSIETITSSILTVINTKYERLKVAKTIEHLGSGFAVTTLNEIINRILRNHLMNQTV
jgi:glycosyltransferase involved in cell wall biosynthesis